MYSRNRNDIRILVTFQRAKEQQRKNMMAVDKIGSDISSSEDELLTGEEPRRSPAAAPPLLDRDQQDNLQDDQVTYLSTHLFKNINSIN